MRFVLGNFNVRVIHPTPIIRIAPDVRKTGCGLSSAARTSRKLSKRTGRSKSSLFETFSLIGWLRSIFQCVYQRQHGGICWQISAGNPVKQYIILLAK